MCVDLAVEGGWLYALGGPRESTYTEYTDRTTLPAYAISRNRCNGLAFLVS